jgi:hypothetical protein
MSQSGSHGAAVTRAAVHIDQMVAAVEELFAEALAEGPQARTLAERRALLREANQAIASQVRDRYQRPWADGDPEAVVHGFICECGDPACDASVRMPVGALSSGAVLARGTGEGRPPAG